MSASDDNSAIFVTDDEKKKIQNKIKRYAFSGGGKTLADHEKHGGNCEIDVPYQYLTFFLDDDNKLQKIREEYTKGKMGTQQIKQELIDVIVPLVLNHRKAREKVTDDVVLAFMATRKLKFS